VSRKKHTYKLIFSIVLAPLPQLKLCRPCD